MNENMSAPAPEPMSGAPKKNNMWLIVGIVIVVLCCCCVIAGVVGWQYGDQILKSLQG